MDEVLRSKVIKILEDEQNELKASLDPQSTVNIPKTVPVIESQRNSDGILVEVAKDEPTSFVDESVTTQYKQKIIDEAITLQQFCKIIDDKILSFNAQINDKKQQIVILSTEAINGNCWPGIACSALLGFPDCRFTFYYGRNIAVKKDIENIRIYPNIAGPTERLDIENPFDPDSIYTLNSTYSGYGYKNLQDPIFYKNKDNTVTGLGSDGSGKYLGIGRFDVSETLTDHNARLISLIRYYIGSNIPGSRCVGIGTSIRILYSEIIELRKQRDSLRENLNILKEDKADRELSSWGVRNIDRELIARTTKNLSAISATKSFDSDDLVNVDAVVLSLDVGDPDSYVGIGTIWYDGSGNGNHATLFPINAPASYEYRDGYYLSFNGVDQYAQTGIKTTNILGVGNTWSIETWFKIDGPPSNLGFTTDVTATGTISGIGTLVSQTGIITGITTTGISIGQYVNEKTDVIGAETTVIAIGVGSVFISPDSINVGIATTTFSFGRYIEYTNALVDVNSSSTSTHMLSVSYAQNGIFENVPTGRLVYTSSQTGVSTTHLVGTAVTNGSWYHGVVVRNGTENTKLYMNGVLVNTYNGDFPLGTASTAFTKIAGWTDENIYSNTSLSIVKVYQKSLTEDEVIKKFGAVKGRFGILG